MTEIANIASCIYMNVRIEKLQKPLTALLIIFIWAVFFARAAIYLDPDFGWHIGAGRYILLHGIPKTDPFSYTMPHFPFVDHEWLTNLWMFKVYSLFGIYDLAFIYASLATLAFLIAIPEKTTIFFAIPLFLAIASTLTFFGIRPQVESWFLIALLLRILSSENLWKKWRFFIPALILVWTNLHGGFPVGLAILIFFLFLKTFQTKIILIGDLLVLISSILVTFINPYGPRLWGEIWMQMTDTKLRWTINEWMPIYFQFSFVTRLGLICYFLLSTFLLIKYVKRIALFNIGLYLGFLILGISSKRHIPLWVILSLPTSTSLIQYFFEDLKMNKFLPHNFVTTKQKKFIIIYSLFIILSLLIFAIQSRLVIKESLYNAREEFNYPKFAVEALKRKNYGGQILTYYNWGGYLIWKYPEKKVFIDGRMPSWRWHSPYKYESDQASLEYKQLVDHGDNTKNVVDKYNIKTILWPIKSDDGTGFVLRSGNQINVKINTSYNFINQLINSGWKVIYTDKTSLILHKD